MISPSRGVAASNVSWAPANALSRRSMQSEQFGTQSRGVWLDSLRGGRGQLSRLRRGQSYRAMNRHGTMQDEQA